MSKKKGGYTRFNYLQKIIDVQKEFKLHYSAGVIIEHVFKEHIHKKFRISRSTFYKFINYPAESELKKLNNEKEQRANQLNLFQLDSTQEPNGDDSGTCSS